MLDAAGIAHARRRHDDGAALDLVDGLAVVYALDNAETGVVEQLLRIELDVVEHCFIFAIDGRHLARERAVEEHAGGRYFLILDEEPDVVEQLLAALDRKDRNDQIAASGKRTGD